MKKAVLKRLQGLASQLPDVVIIKPSAPKTGAELIAEGIQKDGSGRTIKKENSYIGREPGLVDHLNRLKDAYKLGGDKAVGEYCAWAERQANLQKRNIEAAQKKQQTEKVI